MGTRTGRAMTGALILLALTVFAMWLFARLWTKPYAKPPRNLRRFDWTTHITPDGIVHIVPERDSAYHWCQRSEDCRCHPTAAPYLRGDGSYGWLVVHHRSNERAPL